MDKAIFLDRDGTLNIDSSYVNKPTDFNLFPFTINALKKMQSCGYKLIIISNQSGIGRGYFKEEDLDKITKKMLDIFKENEVLITDVFYSYYYEHSDNEKYKENKDWRKPAPGMILKAAEKHNINLKKSYMVGDKLSDIGAGANANCKTVLVLSGVGKQEKKQIKDLVPDYIFKNISELSDFIYNLENF